MTKKLKFPKKITVGGTVYNVETVGYDIDCGGYAGIHEGLVSRIRILSTVDGIQKKESVILETLLHELIHAVDFVYTGNLLKEKTVDKLSVSLFQVLSDNDLKLFDKAYPRKINIAGFKYKIKTNYKPEVASAEAPIRINHATLEYNIWDIKICSQDYLKARFIEGILGVITRDDHLFSEEEMNTLNLPSMSAGLYQVFKGSGLDRIIREWGK